MSEARDKFVKKKIEHMSLEEKVGQLLTFTWRGVLLTPSGIEQITKLHAGGLCLEPYALETCNNNYWKDSQIDYAFQKPAGYFDIAKTFYGDYNFGVSVTPENLTEALNKVQKIAMNRASGIPLHLTIDFEGDFKNDYTSGTALQFVSNMGLAAIGDTELTYKVGLLIGKELSAMGITQIYSPVSDVNINPRNPEIGIRSFSDDPAICAAHVSAIVKGYQEGGIIATAKHYPGRGDSETDAHDTLDKCSADLARMKSVELVPFKAAIDAGAKAIMTGHTIYPAYDDTYPATLSKKIMTDLLRGELGFDGVIVSDAIGMGAILKKWSLPKASVMAIKAGVDTILLKTDDESRSQVFFGIKDAVEKGEIPVERLNDAVRRLLNMKYDQGLFETAGKNDPEITSKIVHDRTNISFSADVAKKALIVLRDDRKLMPLTQNQKILVLEQCIPYCFLGKDIYSHPHILGEAMTTQSTNLILSDTNFHANEWDIKQSTDLAGLADIIVITNYYSRHEKKGNNQHLVKLLKDAGHTVIVVTNYPYIEGATKEADAVICNFSITPDSVRASAELLFGKIDTVPSTKIPLRNNQ